LRHAKHQTIENSKEAVNELGQTWWLVLGFYRHVISTDEGILGRYPDSISALAFPSYIKSIQSRWGGMAMGNKTTNLIGIDYTISSTMYRAYAQICSFDLPHLRKTRK